MRKGPEDIKVSKGCASLHNRRGRDWLPDIEVTNGHFETRAEEIRTGKHMYFQLICKPRLLLRERAHIHERGSTGNRI